AGGLLRASMQVARGGGGGGSGAAAAKLWLVGGGGGQLSRRAPHRRATCSTVSTTPSTRKYPRAMTGYTTVLTQSTGTASAQPTACRILSTTRGYLRTPVPEVHRSRTVRSLMREYERRAVAAEWLASSRGGRPARNCAAGPSCPSCNWVYRRLGRGRTRAAPYG